MLSNLKFYVLKPKKTYSQNYAANTEFKNKHYKQNKKTLGAVTESKNKESESECQESNPHAFPVTTGKPHFVCSKLVFLIYKIRFKKYGPQ